MAKTDPLFLITPKAQLGAFIRPEDQTLSGVNYLGRPVRVEFVRKEGELTYVTDPARGHTYPVQPKHLVKEWALTRRQRLAAQ